MRTKRFLLVTAALSTAATATVACGKDPAVKPEVRDAGEMLPLPANPKGSFYDANIDTPPPPPPPPVQDAGPPIRHPLPANPKGSHYDAGKKKPHDPGF